ncbi:MAG: hypothetical protein Kow00129_17020 [Thermoleophilia bacterium]
MFSRRKGALPAALPLGPSDAFVGEAAKQRQWHFFLEWEQRAYGEETLPLEGALGFLAH